MNSKNRICLWYDGTALEAATFYAETFPDSAVGAITHAPGDYPAGFTDVDAITLSMADYARANSATVAATAITLAALSNTVVKAGMVVSLGGAELRRPVLLASAGLIAVGIATVVAMRWWWGA